MIHHYAAEPGKVQDALSAVLQHGALSGTGKIAILPIDHGFEHGPVASFGGNIDAMDPRYHFRFALETGVSAIAAPYGFLADGLETFKGKIPFILKINSNNLLVPGGELNQALTASVDDAVRLGCVGVGLTIYPGSPATRCMVERAATIIAQARSQGLFTVLWCYPRGPELKGKERAVDILAYVTHMAALLGAHIIKVKLPNNGFVMDKSAGIDLDVSTLEKQINLIVRAAFNGRRIVVFSGNNLDTPDAIKDGVRAIIAGGGHGSIIGRNVFQRPWKEAVAFMQDVIALYKNG